MTESPEIIADRPAAPAAGRWLPTAGQAMALAWLVMAAAVDWQQGLTLSHYDA